MVALFGKVSCHLSSLQATHSHIKISRRERRFKLHNQEPYIAANMATLRDADDAVIAALKSKLQNCSTSLPEKYRILFSLRNLKGPAAHDALQTGSFYATECSCCSSLTLAKDGHIVLDPAHFCSVCACRRP